MKTAISLPDELFEKAERTAREMGLPRSQLFALAIEEFINSHSRDAITEQLNEVYSKDVPASDEVAIDTLRRSLKNDAW